MKSTKLSLLKELENLEHILIHPFYKNTILNFIEENTPKEKILFAIENDPILNIELLKIANSINYGFYRQISSIHHTLKLIDYDFIIQALKNFPVIVSHISNYSEAIGWYSIFYAHSIHCKSILEYLAEKKYIDFSIFFAEKDDIFTAIFLHDIGIFFLITFFPKYTDILNTSKRLALNLYRTENMLLNTNHAILGGYIASKWGLPDSLIYALSYHHTPELSKRYRNMLKLISIIDMLSTDYMIYKEIKKEIEPKYIHFSEAYQ